MYEELIRQFKPKPTFNLTWYKDEDSYSEGEIEDVIIQMIAENESEHYVEAISRQCNWSTYYHLTHIRKNILNWYPFKQDSEVLEIGCGMGAITNMLCEKSRHVTAVELSKKRATATLLRCRDKSNLEIIVGNLNDIQFEKKFDYITLIGVLEYQGTYTDTGNPYEDFLKEVKKLLKPSGKLLIAIENKYGLKYWCGAREDHTGIPFDGMNQYALTTRRVRTFSKAELEKLVKNSGFKNTYFYYPMPDYKLPTVIYSQEKLPSNSNMQNLRPYYAPDNQTLIADEMDIYKDIIENNAFEFFANSFLVECSDEATLGEIIYANISSGRLEEYRVLTRFTKDAKVEKVPLSPSKGKEHLQQIVKNQNILERAGLKVWQTKVEEEKMISDYAPYALLEDSIVSAYEQHNEERIYELYNILYKEILNSSEHIAVNENILIPLNITSEDEIEKYGVILRIGYLDMIARNAFDTGEEIFWFDQEWILESVPVGYIFYRALKEVYNSYSWMEEIISIRTIARKYDIFKCWAEYEQLEAMFIGTCIDQLHMAESGVFRGADKTVCIQNIEKIL